MSEKTVSPLNNPSSEKSVSNSNSSKKSFEQPGIRVRRGDVGGSPRGEKRVIAVEAIVRCQMCGWRQKIVFAYGKPPGWHKCINCQQIQPMDGYRVSMYGGGLPTVLTPTEVANREKVQEREKGAVV